jgi:hypothetical protein
VQKVTAPPWFFYDYEVRTFRSMTTFTKMFRHNLLAGNTFLCYFHVSGRDISMGDVFIC